MARRSIATCDLAPLQFLLIKSILTAATALKLHDNS